MPEARLTIIQVWQRETKVGNGAAHPIEAGGSVVPAGLERSEVKIEFSNYGIHGIAVRRARDQPGRSPGETRWFCWRAPASETVTLRSDNQVEKT